MKNMLRIIFTLLFLSCSCLTASAESFKIGVAGDLAEYGIPSEQAAEIFAARNTINGQTIEIVLKNDNCNNDDARTVATEFNSSGIKFIIGHTCSGSTKEALSIYPSDTILISPASSMPELTNGDYPNFFRTIHSDSYMTEFIGKLTLDILDKENIVIVYDDTVYGNALAYGTRDYIFSSSKGKIQLYQEVQLDDSDNYDYTSLISAIAAAKPDIVICLGANNGFNINVLNRIRTAGISCDFVVDDASKSDEFISGIGSNTEGVYVVSGKDITDAYFAVDLITHYKNLYSTDENPGWSFFKTYSALMALKNAVEKSGSTAFNAVSTALKNEYINTPIGRIKFSDQGDVIGSSMVAYNIYNNHFVEFFDGRLSFEQVDEKIAAECMIIAQIEKNKWDVGGDNIIDIKEAITALKITAGQKTSVVKIGVEPYYPPYVNLVNGKVVGFDVDIMDAIALRMGFNYEIIQIPWDNTFPELVNGEIDVEYGGISIVPSRYALFNYSASYAVENDDYLGFAINKDKTDLLYIINRGLLLIKEDGTYDQIYNTWFPQ